eukprot:CAMPEP_0203751768 /NCGR_PEP_ID=MMETSP0098-20131031/5787_1 /ASSEMBLY_ACC=CAM_ASM_000208 /TAXON_ID=96639 /ORGANISM=" , Strain NY0313808BC1" /LENGTH=281 /DNA_ID=CAMNT_0050641641 /DNA_START=12 /DNA_END=854 /DNA_ORIENTATION=+
MKFVHLFVGFFAVAYMGNSEEAMEEATMSTGSTPYCKRLTKTKWWKDRQALKRIKKNNWDTVCNQFSIDNLKRTLKRLRQPWNGTVAYEACVNRKSPIRTFIGAHRRTDPNMVHVPCGFVGNVCTSLPCMGLNSGTCKMNETAGFCFWMSTSQAKEIGASRSGCYRNQCILQYGHPDAANTCESQGVKGFYNCTWCGARTGCHVSSLSEVKTQEEAGCSRVGNNPIKELPKDKFWRLKNNTACTCNTESRTCSEWVKSMGDAVEKVFGNDTASNLEQSHTQ